MHDVASVIRTLLALLEYNPNTSFDITSTTKELIFPKFVYIKRSIIKGHFDIAKCFSVALQGDWPRLKLEFTI